MAKARPITGLSNQAATGANARVIVRTRLEEMYQWQEYVDEPDSVLELHDMRIAAKRLRYTLEVFEEVLPENTTAIVNEVTQIQEELGELHDSDVMIALLGLCLGSQDSGTGYEYVLAKAHQQPANGSFILDTQLVTHLIDPRVAPTLEERRGLEHLLRDVQQRREEQYEAFRQHWHQLQARDFRGEILAILDT